MEAEKACETARFSRQGASAPRRLPAARAAAAGFLLAGLAALAGPFVGTPAPAAKAPPAEAPAPAAEAPARVAELPIMRAPSALPAPLPYYEAEPEPAVAEPVLAPGDLGDPAPAAPVLASRSLQPVSGWRSLLDAGQPRRVSSGAPLAKPCDCPKGLAAYPQGLTGYGRSVVSYGSNVTIVAADAAAYQPSVVSYGRGVANPLYATGGGYPPVFQPTTVSASAPAGSAVYARSAASYGAGAASYAAARPACR